MRAETRVMRVTPLRVPPLRAPAAPAKNADPNGENAHVRVFPHAVTVVETHNKGPTKPK